MEHTPQISVVNFFRFINVGYDETNRKGGEWRGLYPRGGEFFDILKKAYIVSKS